MDFLYSSSRIIRKITSKRMRWARHMACMEEKRKCTGFWWESPWERDHAEDRDVDGMMGSEWILERLVGVVEWIQLVQDRDRWRVFVNTVMKLRVWRHGVG
jgi:hypothetical protein